MPSTYYSLHYHFVFSTKDRRPTIRPDWRPRLHADLGGIVRGMGGVAEAVGGVDDHVHILASLKPSHCLSDVMRDLKKQATVWVQETNDPTFSWQEGYAVLSVGTRDVPLVREYISSQAEHHAVVTFIEELQDFLRDAGVSFDDRFLS